MKTHHRPLMETMRYDNTSRSCGPASPASPMPPQGGRTLMRPSRDTDEHTEDFQRVFPLTDLSRYGLQQQ
ncbi:hypothetical protein SKAU_G00305980 [Synaphobranchus kaupii]|uniref:Uncharacterized protein n=1 Tax=Synaphobranchus kaupii TaxID=118154 RepID=A0A9Q1IIP0_SYNKA|nr:hypothetical protein SKAU_G00305980 [Synaphobranchus kaupii]